MNMKQAMEAISVGEMLGAIRETNPDLVNDIMETAKKRGEGDADIHETRLAVLLGVAYKTYQDEIGDEVSLETLVAFVNELEA